MAMAFAAAPVGIFLTGWLVQTIGLHTTLAIFGERDRVVPVERSVEILNRTRGRRPGLDLDEVVALEEDARAHLHRRVAVDRQAGLLDRHHDDGGVRALVRLDGLDLADLDAGDPHR